MKRMTRDSRSYILRMGVIAMCLNLIACGNGTDAPAQTAGGLAEDRANLGEIEAIAYDAFIYAYPLMEQVKTVNGMFEFMGM